MEGRLVWRIRRRCGHRASGRSQEPASGAGAYGPGHRALGAAPSRPAGTDRRAAPPSNAGRLTKRRTWTAVRRTEPSPNWVRASSQQPLVSPAAPGLAFSSGGCAQPVPARPPYKTGTVRFAARTPSISQCRHRFACGGLSEVGSVSSSAAWLSPRRPAAHPGRIIDNHDLDFLSHHEFFYRPVGHHASADSAGIAATSSIDRMRAMA